MSTIGTQESIKDKSTEEFRTVRGGEVVCDPCWLFGYECLTPKGLNIPFV